MELLQLKYFCDAAKSENFSKTAKKYFVPTSNISQSIKRLEKELGVELFEHRTNRISLNESGKLFYKNISLAISLIEDAKRSISDGEKNISGEIRLVCLCNRRIVTSAIEKFVQKYPKINFNIRHSFEEGQDFDIFISDNCPFEYGERLLIVDEDMLIAMSKDHPLATKKDLKITDLENERFITMPSYSSLYKTTVKLCNDAGFAPDITIQTDDPFYLRKYIDLDLGVALVPEKSWRGLWKDSTVLHKIQNAKRKTYAYTQKNRYTRKATELFIDVLKKEDLCEN